MSALTKACPACEDVRLKLDALNRALQLSPVVLNWNVPSEGIYVVCEFCHNTGSVLTPEGRSFLAAIRPVLGLPAAQPADEDAVAY